MGELARLVDDGSLGRQLVHDANLQPVALGQLIHLTRRGLTNDWAAPRRWASARIFRAQLRLGDLASMMVMSVGCSRLYQRLLPCRGEVGGRTGMGAPNSTSFMAMVARPLASPSFITRWSWHSANTNPAL